MIMLMGIGDDIRKLRKERGLGVNELAAKARLTGATISNWENEERFPRKTELFQLLEKLNAEIRIVLKDTPMRRQMGPASVSELRALMVRVPNVTADDVDRIMFDVENTVKFNRQQSKTQG